MNGVRLPSLPQLPRPVTLALRWLLSIAVIVVVGLALRGRFTSVTQSGVPWPAAWSLVATLALFIVANEILVRAWMVLMHMGGAELERKLARWVWAKSQLARYAVGMAQVASRAIVARRHGLKSSTGAVTTLLEVVWFACINGLMAAATIPWWLPETGLTWAAWFAVLPGIVILLAVASPRLFLRTALLVAKLPFLRRFDKADRVRDLDVSHGETRWLTLMYVANASVRLAGFLCLYVGVGGTLDHSLRVTGAFALGHLIGAVAVFAPGGIGPREGVTAVALAPVIGAGPVLMLVGATRLFELLAELVYAGFARWRWSRFVQDHPEADEDLDAPVEDGHPVPGVV